MIVQRRPSRVCTRALALTAGIAATIPCTSALPEETVAPASVPLDAVPQRLEFPAISIRRDPFAQPDQVGLDSAALPAGDGLSVLPPNDAILMPVLRAVIAGSPPKALLELRGRAAIVGIGSRVAGATVVAISSDAILLDDGTRLAIGRRFR